MEIWIFMLIMNLLIPITMIGCGSYFIKKAPRTINQVFGYRTAMSMKNADTWKFAHQHCGQLWRIIGWIMLVASAITMLFVSEKDADYVGLYGGILCGIQVALLITSIFPTEIALRKNFDKLGLRKS